MNMIMNRGVYNETATESHEEEEMELKRGPWTLEEDLLLLNYITNHGEGHWNYLACCSGLKRTGKSCRLRWMNYLRPDVRRGNITLEEQVTILQLHSRWGNRWSKIAQHLPGRTDNEIKNYWRTRVQKHAKQMGCDVTSKLFQDTMRHNWIPRLEEKIHAERTATATSSSDTTTTTIVNAAPNHVLHARNDASISASFTSENSAMDSSSVSDASLDLYNTFQAGSSTSFGTESTQIDFEESLTSPLGYINYGFQFQVVEENNPWVGNDDLWGNFL